MNEVDKYIAAFPPDIQEILMKIRAIIKDTAGEAVESMTYGMPAYKTNGRPLVYFGCFKNHIGFYATPTGHEQFSSELSKYKHGKGSVQFLLNEPVPFDLIMRIVEFRVQENNLKASS